MRTAICTIAASLVYIAFFWPGNTEYNCHAFAWGFGRVWVEGIDLPPIPPDNVIMYGDRAHSAWHIGNGWCLSKMGSMLILPHPVKAVEFIYGPVSETPGGTRVARSQLARPR